MHNRAAVCVPHPPVRVESLMREPEANASFDPFTHAGPAPKRSPHHRLRRSQCQPRLNTALVSPELHPDGQ